MLTRDKNATLIIQSFKQSTVSLQSVTVSKANSGYITADVQSVLLVLERITRDVLSSLVKVMFVCFAKVMMCR